MSPKATKERVGTIRTSARLIAPAAQAWLRQTTSARVAHVFAHACNLINTQNAMLSVVAPHIGAGPFALVLSVNDRLDDFSRVIETGSAVTIDGKTLALGPLVIETNNARLWQPRPAWENIKAQPHNVRRHLPALNELLVTYAPSDSLASLVVGPPQRWTDTFASQFLQAALPPIEMLRDAFWSNDMDGCAAAAFSLAGLGPGLTPAGDDFLVGTLHAMWAAYAPQQARRMAAGIVAAALPRTSHLSAAWLRAAARGEASEPWHALIEGLAAGDTAALLAAAREITNTGHTSGADALAGFVATLRTMPPLDYRI